MISARQLNEYEALTAGVGFVDISSRTKIELRSADCATFLHNFSTNDIKRLQPGQGCEAFVCNVKGHIVGHVQVFCHEASLWIDTVPGQAEKLISHLDRYLIREKVEIIDRTNDLAEFVIAGPLLTSRLELSSGVPLPESLWSHVHLDASPRISLRRIDLGNRVGYALLAERSSSELLAGMLSAIPPYPFDVLEMLRIEAGYPAYEIDITPENLPQEVGRDRTAVSFTKGCYLGQETVARIDALGHVNKKLCGVTFPASEESTLAGLELTQAGKAVGKITSAGWSPRLGKMLGLAYLRRGCTTPGSAMQLPWGEAIVVRLPV